MDRQDMNVTTPDAATVSLPLFRDRPQQRLNDARQSGSPRGFIAPRMQTQALRRVSILGATGSIGDSTAQVLRRVPEHFDVIVLVGGKNVAKMAQLVREFRPKVVAMADENAAGQLREAIQASHHKVEILAGRKGVLEASAIQVDICVGAITGFAGLEPVLRAIAAGSDIALANKESMVCAGPLVIAAAQRHGVDIVPTDSEHSALFQCLLGQDLASVQNLVLTASGGPFRAFSPSELGAVTVDQALAHPNWSMGSKVTIDSATLMNKGLELIEARWLFGIAPERLSAVVHPQSIIHSMVHYHDGSFLAQMGEPTMTTPIALALGWPNRLDLSAPHTSAEPADLITQWSGLTFDAIDEKRFPCFALAKQAMAQGMSACVVLNAVNEVAVEAFLAGQISFQDIGLRVATSLDACERNSGSHATSFDDIIQIDSWARQLTW